MHYTKSLLLALRFLLRADHRDTLLLTLALAIQGLIPAYTIWVVTLSVEVIQTTLNTGRPPDSGYMLALIVAWFVAVAVSNLLDAWSVVVQGNLNDKLTAYVNQAIMQKSEGLLGLHMFEDAAYFDELQVIEAGASYQPLNLLIYLANALRGGITILSVALVLATVAWWLPIILIAAALPQAYAALKLQNLIWEATVATSVQARSLQYVASIMLSREFAKEARIFGVGAFAIGKYQKIFREHYALLSAVRARQGRQLSLLTLFSTAGNGLVFAWVIVSAVSTTLVLSSVVVFVQSLIYIQQNIFATIRDIGMLHSTLLYFQQLQTFLLREDPLPLALPGIRVNAPLEQGITFEDVSFAYPDGRTALKGVSLHIAPGETVAIVGENGAGKTTLVKLLARFYDPTHGTITVDGHDLRALDVRHWRGRISAIFQDFGEYAFTVSENIAFVDHDTPLDHQRLDHAAKQAGIDAVIYTLPAGYETVASKEFGGTDFSGGQWQKIALARAYWAAQDADILILDEPTAALDPRSEHELYSQFTAIAQDKTTLLITHRLASVQDADRILVFKDGALVEQGTHDELLSRNGEYAELWRMQVSKYGVQSPD
jgi:ATP-binding cassette subfamily B protein